MDKLVTMIQDAGNLYDALVEMREKRDTNTSGGETDFKRLSFCAGSAPFHGHRLANQSEFVRRAYLRLLAGLVSQTQAQCREAKIVHIGRILAAMPDGDLESLFTDAATITTDDLESFRESLPEELRPLFLFDLLLLCWLDGEPEEAELRYAAGFMSAFAMPEKQSEALAKAVRAVLGQDRDALFGLVNDIPCELFLCYLDQSDCAIVASLEEARQIKGKSVIIFHTEISNLDLPIDMDVFPAKSVEFQSCTFQNMQGLFAERLPVKIVNCRFEQCKVAQNLLALHKATIQDTDFIKCEATRLNGMQIYLIACRESIIENCTFLQDIIQCSDCMDRGGLLGTIESTITNCKFQACFSDGGYYNPCFISVKGGTLNKCQFKDCIVKKEGFLFNSVDAVINNNTIKGCFYSSQESNDMRHIADINTVFKAQRERIQAAKNNH